MRGWDLFGMREISHAWHMLYKYCGFLAAWYVTYDAKQT